MVEFKMVGFKHISVGGAKAYWKLMHSQGTVGLLWDISNQQRVATLLQTNDFNRSDYSYDAELHEELCDARFGLEYAFISGVDNMSNQEGTRHLMNCQSLIKTIVNTLDDLSKYCCEHCTHDTKVVVDVVALHEDGYETCISFTIVGAEEFNTFEDMIVMLKEHGYQDFTFNIA